VPHIHVYIYIYMYIYIYVYPADYHECPKLLHIPEVLLSITTRIRIDITHIRRGFCSVLHVTFEIAP
jgi:hypothetical protein